MLFTFNFAERMRSWRWEPKLRLLKICAVRLWLIGFSCSAHGADLTSQGSYQFDFTAPEMLFDVSRGCAYLTDFDGRLLLKVSLTNGAVLSQISFTNRPGYAAISPNRQRLYVGLWTMDSEPNSGALAEVDLNTFTVTTSFPVSVQPTFLVATDNRLVVVSGSGPGFIQVKCYSAASGLVMDSISGGFAYFGNRLVMHSSQSALYTLPVDISIPTFCVQLRRFNASTGDISYPSSFSSQYCLPDAAYVNAMWLLPGEPRLLLSNGDVLNVTADPVVLNYRQRLEEVPTHLATVDSINQTLFTVALPNRLHQFHLATLAHGASFSLTNVGSYYWLAANRDTLWFGRQESGRTFLEAYSNPAMGGATNRPPVPQFNFVPVAPTTINVIVFDAAASHDENTLLEELVYRWDWESDGEFDTSWQPTSIAAHQFNIAGTNRVTLEVRDRFGLKTNYTATVVVEFAPDAGHAPVAAHQPFVLPFASSGAMFHPRLPLLYVLQASSNRLVSVNLSNGLVERVFDFLFSPQAAALTPDGDRLFVGLVGPSGTNGYFAEFRTDPLIKVGEWSSGFAPQLMAATDAGLVIAAGNSGRQGSVRAFVAAAQAGGNNVPLTLGFGGLATSREGDEVYAADELFGAKVSWHATLDPLGELGLPLNFPEECGTGGFLVLPRNGWILRNSGGVCTPQSAVVTNLNHYAVAFAADSTRDAFVTLDGTARLHAFYQSDGVEFGSYSLTRQASFLGSQDGRVYAVAVSGEETFIERRLLPATDLSNNVPPTINFLTPTNGFVVQEGETVTVTVQAFDPDGTVTNVTLLVDDTPFQTTESQAVLYWTAALPGAHTLQAVAIDNFGAASTSSVVEVVVNFPPTIHLVSPAPDAQLIVPATVNLVADASDPDGRIVRVDFYRHYSLFATITNPPFALSFIESNRTYHVYSAVATDNTGAQSGTPEQFVYFIGLPGDDINDAFHLDSTNRYSTNLSNLMASREKLEPLHAGKPGNHSMWWSWTAPSDGSLVVSTRNSSFDTLLAAYSGPVFPWMTFSGLTLLAANDDDPADAPTSRIKFAVQGGVTYRLVVDGYAEAAGDIAFALDFAPLPVLVTNDFLATTIDWNSETNYAVANNSAATREPEEPLHAGNAGGRSLWWSWIHDTAGYVTLSTEGSSLDTLVAVYVHNGIGPLTGSNLLPIASNDDDPRGGRTSWLRFPSFAWQTYYLAVDGYNGASGDLRLSLSWEPAITRPTNDAFQDAAMLSGLQATATAFTAAATKEPDELPHAGNPGGHSVWWQWNAPAQGRTTISTKGSSFDTLLSVYTGDNVSTVALVSANDDDPLHPPTSLVQFSANSGTTYWVAVDGFNGASGHVSLTLSSAAAPAPQLTMVQTTDALCELTIRAEVVQWLVIESSTNLNTWLPVSTNRVSAGSNIISVPSCTVWSCPVPSCCRAALKLRLFRTRSKSSRQPTARRVPPVCKRHRGR